jgi:hypothetical protein
MPLKTDVDRTVTIKLHPDLMEKDVKLVFPCGDELTIQIRGYQADTKTLDGASVDILLPRRLWVYNWRGGDMHGARSPSGQPNHVRNADQLMFIYTCSEEE